MLAASCFWGVQHYFDQVPGVVQTEAGYTGGHVDHPTYDQVCAHTTGHAEAVRLEFDPGIVSYEMLIRQFFRMHDPTIPDGDGVNVGSNYRSAIFYTNNGQRQAAQEIMEELSESTYHGGIVTELSEAGKWWPAEAYHQKFAERTGRGMCHVAYRPA